jgi:hypothetical protein
VRLLLAAILGAVGFAVLVRFVAKGARRPTTFSAPYQYGGALLQPDPYTPQSWTSP